MSRKVQFLLVGLLVLALAASLVGCSPATPEAVPTEEPEVSAVEEPTLAPEVEEPTVELEAEEPVVVRYAWVGEPDRLEGQYMTSSGFWIGQDILWSQWDSFGADGGQLTPRTAESIDVSDDGLTYTVHLFPGMTWSDGTPLDAHNYAAYWDWVKDISISGWYQSTANAVSWEALDDLTFQFTLSQPNGSFRGNDSVYLNVLPVSTYGEMDEEGFWAYETDYPVLDSPVEISE